MRIQILVLLLQNDDRRAFM